MLLHTIPLFLIGGTGYVTLELLYRGRSHISMFVAGGLCFLLLGRLEKKKLGYFRPLAGAGLITLVELMTGLLVNRDYRVWDYRGIPGNLWGQICPRFFLLWIPLAYLGGKAYRLASARLERR